MRLLTSLAATILIGGCVVRLNLDEDKPLQRAVHVGEKDKVGFFLSLTPTCEVDVLPEISVVKPPSHGSVYFETGQGYANYSPNNIRYECNKQLVQGTQLSYQSLPGFQGNDSFVVNARFANSDVRTMTYNLTVR